MMWRQRISKWQGYRYKLLVPYGLAFALLAGVGYQLNSSLFAETVVEGEIRLSTDKPVYHVGDEVRFTITNDTAVAVSVLNDCPGEPLDVYRQVGGQWQQLHDAVPYASKCDGEPREYTVKPDGGSASATYRFWDHLFDQAGHYRLVAPLQGIQQRPQVEFNVVGDSD